MLIDVGLLRFEEDLALRGRSGRRNDPSDDPPPPRGPARPAGRGRAGRDRAWCRRGQGVPRRRRHQSERGPSGRTSGPAPHAGAEGADPPGPTEFAGEDAFRFRHLLIRDAAYQAMPKEQRAELHRTFRRLAHRGGSRPDGRIRGDPRPPPRAGVSIPRRARYGRRPGACTGRSGGRAPARVRVPRGRARKTWRRPGCSSTAASRSPTAGPGPHAGRACRAVAGSASSGRRTTPRFRRSEPRMPQETPRSGSEPSSFGTSRASVDPTQTMAQARDETERLLAEAERLGDADVQDRAVLALTQELFFLGQTAAAIRLLEHLADRAQDAETRSFRDRRSARRQLVRRSDPGPGGLRHARPRRGARGEGPSARAHDLGCAARCSVSPGASTRRASFAEAEAIYDELRRPDGEGGDEPGRRGDPAPRDASRTQGVSSVGCTRRTRRSARRVPAPRYVRCSPTFSTIEAGSTRRRRSRSRP